MFDQSFPAGLPQGVENACNGIAVDRLRASGDLPKKGRMNIKGGRWMRRLMQFMPLFEQYYEDTRPSVDRTCELNPNFDGC